VQRASIERCFFLSWNQRNGGYLLTLVTGNVPVGIASDDIVSDGLMLIGDGARQADPLTGGGIANAMIAAQLAAEVAVDAVERSDTSRDSLKEYQRRWTKDRGRKMA